jgi:hypothetical protein
LGALRACVEMKLRFLARRPALEPRTALGADDGVFLVQDELAADEAFETRAAEKRQELVLERSVERFHLPH